MVNVGEYDWAQHYYSAGYTDGKKLGTTEGDKAGYDKAYPVAYSAAYDLGLVDGTTAGNQQGLSEGKDAGFSAGWDVGYGKGYDLGYDVGILYFLTGHHERPSFQALAASFDSTTGNVPEPASVVSVLMAVCISLGGWRRR